MSNILPHELKWLNNKLEEGRIANQQAAHDMGDAVESGNVWHDNAAYDEVRDRMKLIDNTYGPLSDALIHSEVENYPEIDAEQIALGSLVRIRDTFSPNAYDALIVGIASLNPHKYQQAWENENNEEELTVVGVEASLGKALIGGKVGDIITVTNANGSSYDADIIAVDNAWLDQHADALTATDF